MKPNRLLLLQITVAATLGVALAWGGADRLRAQSARAYGPELFQALEWRSIGPDRGGRSIASAGVVGRPFEYYFGAVGGGLWKTTDGGVNWEPVTDGQLRSSSVGAVAVSESNPDVIYIGMGEVCLRGNIMQGDGLYKSSDAGKTWAHVGLPDSQVISEIVVHPTNPDVVYAAAFGHVTGPNEERGVFRSRDGGKTWRRVLFRDAKSGAVDLVMDRHDPNVLYAALWEAYRVSYQMSSGGPGSGLFKTADGGDTWTELTRRPGMPDGVVGRIGVAVSPADSKRVWALVENENGGLFRSDDGGETWTKTNDDRRLRQRAFYYTHVYADPKDRERVYVLNTGFYRSDDGGKTFPVTIRVPHGDNHDLWIDPNDPMRMVNSNDGGGTVSTNGGQTWTDEDFPTAQFYHVTTTRDFPYHVCGAQQDNSTACVSSQGGGRGRTAPVFYSAGGGESGYIAPHPTNADLFYAGSQGALLTKFNRATGYIRDIQVYPRFFSGEPSSALEERWQWTFPIVFSPQDPNVLYTTSQHLWRSTNDGQTWQRISPDLTKADPKTLGHSGGPITGDMNGPEIFATIFALAPSPVDPGVIYTGSDDGLVHVTRDGGKNWTNVTPPDLPELSRVSIIDASAHDAGSAYVAAKRYLLGDRAPYIFRTHDYGRTWRKVVSGIRADDYIHVVREDPKRQGLLYAGGEHHVWVSFDDGDQWQSLSLNLPDTQMTDLVVEEHDLVLATHGRSFWILDDISPLRQMTPEAAAADVHLFQPRDAIRSANTAAIYYTLKRPAERVTIDFLDAGGAVIETFTQTAEQEKRAGAEPPAGGGGGGGFGGGPARGPSTKTGLNRFTWDLRYPGHSTFPGMILWSARANGPLAVPGTYQVRLAAHGQTLTRRFQVKKHPLYTDVTEADLQAQFDLAIQVRDRTSEANDAVVKIRAIRTQVDDRLGKTKDQQVASTGQALKQKLSTVEEELYQVRNRSNQDPLNFPIKLNNRLASLRRSVETGDARPTDGAHVVFKELSAELDEQLGMLEEILQTELSAFNDALKRARLEPVQVK